MVALTASSIRASTADAGPPAPLTVGIGKPLAYVSPKMPRRTVRPCMLNKVEAAPLVAQGVTTSGA